uniref:Retrovirus-related Pol polyprotein from transposon TNT 1-94-like beta-barrel domain-containing protein n=1 Tax=Cajanus cajan TaxID=3821 RepID=A0A151R034_CAJCA|nr:hypothetical protein KK1_043068 [Cajanus cajan]
MENEGQAVNRPPLFRGTKYEYWKQRMIAFFDACPIDMWDVVEQGNYFPLDQVGNEIPKVQWSEEQKQRFVLNSKARNALMCALSEEEYTKVHNFRSAKHMWDTLALTYEGSLDVKRYKLSLLARKYELFEMEESASIETMFGRFQTIVNKLSFLGRTYDNFHNIDKLLRSLPRKWRPQVTSLRASKNLEKLSLEELIELLKVHELELQQDDARRKQKSIALNVQNTTYIILLQIYSTRTKNVQSWYLDSGYSLHMTGERSMFLDLKSKKGGQVTFGGGQKGLIMGIGKIGINSTISIDNVLYVKGLTHNLRSICQLCDSGYEVSFNKDKCTISQPDSSILFIANRCNNLYKTILNELENHNVDCLVSYENQWI